MPFTGLITLHHVPNFGAFIQSWSMVQTLRRLGHEVEVIDYRPPGNYLKYRRRGFRRCIPSLGRWRGHRFMEAQLPLSRTVRTPAQVDGLVESGRYDQLVCGSDQVWLKDNYRGFDRTYFLGVGKGVAVRRVSYAPSCGNLKSYGSDEDLARRLIGGLDAISVRDENTMNLVRALGIEDAVRVVDPSLLADFDELIGNRPLKQDYIAVTGPMNMATDQLIARLATRSQLTVLSVGTHCAAANHEKRYVHAGEWVNCLAHARMVITSLFHGAAVSIALRKPFIAVDTAGRAFKLTDLLGRFGMPERFVSVNGETNQLADRLIEMNYDPFEAAIRADVRTSMDYLKKALDG